LNQLDRHWATTTSSSRRPTRAGGAVVLFLCLTVPLAAVATTLEEAEEYEAKTALLYAFAKFVKWPDEAFAHVDSPFVFAVMGENPFGDALNSLRDKRIHGRRIDVRSFASVDEFEPCQLLFCDQHWLEELSERDPLLFEGNHILTAGESAQFTETGGIVCISVSGDHLGFKINAAAARRARLELSSSLFKLAESIIDSAE
jgi:hypothetical protein